MTLETRLKRIENPHKNALVTHYNASSTQLKAKKLLAFKTRSALTH
jgi:hypothetical protein